MSGSWMSIIEYARHNNVSDMTVRRRIKTGRLRAELREGKYFIPVQQAAQTHHQDLETPRISSYTAPRKEESKERVEMPLLPRHIHAVTEPSRLEMEMDRLSENIEGVLERLNQHESILKANFESERKRFQDKMDYVEVELKTKNQDIAQLREEIEDLEILVHILEKKLSTL